MIALTGASGNLGSLALWPARGNSVGPVHHAIRWTFPLDRVAAALVELEKESPRDKVVVKIA